MQLQQEIETLRALFDSGEREGCARALTGLRDRYRREPAAFDPPTIQVLRDIAEALKAEPDLRARLKAVFGYDAFRPGQEAVIKAVLAGRDCLAVMPTGARSLGVSAPGFVWAVVLMLLFAYFVPLFPIAGRISDDFAIPPVTGFLVIDTVLAGNVAALGDAARHVVLPAFALALSGIGQVSRLTRAHMIETYEKPYIEMAEAYGFPERRIANKYALKPSMIPSLTIIGLEFAALLGSAFLVESVFAWPGLSKYGVQVILRKDLNAIVGTVLVISCMFLIANIVVDLLVLVINPRIRLSQRR